MLQGTFVIRLFLNLLHNLYEELMCLIIIIIIFIIIVKVSQQYSEKNKCYNGSNESEWLRKYDHRNAFWL